MTTEWVLAEFLNSCSRGPARQAAADFVRTTLQDVAVESVPASHRQFVEGLALYADRLDKGWSLIDCISFQVMWSGKITHALAFDDHFWQAGFEPFQ